MRIAELELTNWMALRDLCLSHLGRVQVAEGDNGFGKTAILKAITAGFEGAGPEKITVGEDRATVLIRTDDATTIRRMISRVGGKGKGTVSVTNAKGAAIKSPQAYLSALLGAGCFNPLAIFLAEDGEARQKLVTSLVDVAVTDDDWRAWGLSDEQIEAVHELGEGLHPLQVLAEAEKAMVEKRRVANKAVVDARKAVTAARPPESEREVPPSIEEAKAAVVAADAAVDEHSKVQDQFAAHAQAIATKRAAVVTEEDRIESLRATIMEAEERAIALEAEAAALTVEYAKQQNVAEAIYTKADQERHAELMVELEVLEAKRDEADPMFRAAETAKTDAQRKNDDADKARSLAPDYEAKIVAANEAADTMRTELTEMEATTSAQAVSDQGSELRLAERLAVAEESWARVAEPIAGLQAEAEQLDKVVGLLRAAPATLMTRAEMPIAGLGLAEGDITYQTEPDGPAKPGGELCGREMILLGLQIARAQTPCGIICIDGIEALSQKSFAEFIDMTKDDGCQYWVTKVTDGDSLTVATIDPDPALDQAAADSKAATERKAKGGSKLKF